MSAADRVLLRAQTDGTQNGIYTVTTVGDGSNPFVLTRALDFNTNAEIGAGSFMFVEAGSTNASKSFIQTASSPTLDTTALTFSLFGDNTIAANAITNSKLAQMAQATVKGRAAGTGSGDPVDLSADQIIAVINAASSGTINTARVASMTGNGLVAILNTATNALDSGTF